MGRAFDVACADLPGKTDKLLSIAQLCGIFAGDRLESVKSNEGCEAKWIHLVSPVVSSTATKFASVVIAISRKSLIGIKEPMLSNYRSSLIWPNEKAKLITKRINQPVPLPKVSGSRPKLNWLYNAKFDWSDNKGSKLIQRKHAAAVAAKCLLDKIFPA
ncbi:hypothetical protein [Rheinheimera sp. SA_1]|uniref:hypothetical protein n=1 Tax=Rheinheimera sp. SA_1 TaxID=1827365 RepID=UPI003FA6C1D6